MQEVARLGFRAALLAVAIGTVSWVLACQPTVNRARADTLAETRLQEYTYDDLNRLTSASHVQLVRGFTGLLQWIRLFFGRAL